MLFTKYIKSAIGLLLAVAGVVACKKNNDSPENELAKALSTYTYSYVEQGSAVRLHGIAYNDTTLKYRGFPVSLSAAAGSETVVTATIDTTLIATYNSLYHETNPLFNSSAFKLSFNGSYTIKANELTATDSLYVLLKSATTLTDSAVYLIPVRLTAKNGASLVNTIVFFKMYVTSTSIDAYLNGGYTDTYNYFLTWNGSATCTYFNQRDADGNFSSTGDVVRISTFLRTKFPSADLHAYAVLDLSDSVINAFGTATGYTYKPFPAGTYELVKSSVTVPANANLSKDSLVLNLSHYEKFENGTYYLLGIKMVQSPDDVYSIPPMNSTASWAFIRMYFYQQ